MAGKHLSAGKIVYPRTKANNLYDLIKITWQQALFNLIPEMDQVK